MSDIIKQKTGGKTPSRSHDEPARQREGHHEQTKIGALDFVRINVADEQHLP
jgi:hypothetical protein